MFAAHPALFVALNNDFSKVHVLGVHMQELVGEQGKA